jgi:hypothetical protein
MSDRPTLCELGVAWGTDKHDDIHFPENGDLASFYHSLLKDRRDSIYKVLEVGIGTKEAMRHTGKPYTPGASLFMWEAYFPNADIYALDVAPEVLINQGRIRSFRCDQGDGGSLMSVLPYLGHGFDFIVDDGSHIPEHQIKTARMFFPLLAPGGIYAIEDIPIAERNHVASGIPWKSEFHEVIDIYGGIGDLVLVMREGEK